MEPISNQPSLSVQLSIPISEPPIIITTTSNSTEETKESTPITRRTKITLAITFFSVFLDFMGVSIIQPILPFYAEMFNADAIKLGLLYSSYYIMSFIASLFMGKLSDIIGRKPMILFSLFGTCIGFLLCGLANNYYQLLAYRFILGFFGSSSVVAMAVITDSTSGTVRRNYLSLVSVIIMLSYIIGPIVGVSVAKFGIRIPFFVSSAAGALGFLFALLFMQETHPKKQKNQENNNININEQQNLEELNKLNKINESNNNNDKNDKNSKIPIQIWIFCIVCVLVAFTFSVYESMFVLYMIETYHLSTLYIGYILATVISMMTLSNFIFILGSEYLGMYVQTIVASVWCGIGLILLPFIIDNLWIFLAVCIFGFGLSFGQMYTATNVIPTAWTSVDNRGIVLGITNASSKISLIVGPLIAGWLYEMNKSYPWFFSAINAFLACFIIIGMICKWPKQTIPSKRENITEIEQSDSISTNQKLMEGSQ